MRYNQKITQSATNLLDQADILDKLANDLEQAANGPHISQPVRENSLVMVDIARKQAHEVRQQVRAVYPDLNIEPAVEPEPEPVPPKRKRWLFW